MATASLSKYFTFSPDIYMSDSLAASMAKGRINAKLMTLFRIEYE